jgi:hypothetical protein
MMKFLTGAMVLGFVLMAGSAQAQWWNPLALLRNLW